MANRRDSLTPPERTHTEDPGAHDLDSESDDHFSDAQSIPAESLRTSPIPKTRVEKIDNEPSYGEVPGTEAYRMREGDAEPDEIAVIQDSGHDNKESDAAGTLLKPHVPTTVLEEAPDAEGAKTPDGKKHEADPVPDLVVKADGTLEISGTETTAFVDAPIPTSSLPASPEPRSAGTAADDADREDENDGDNEDDVDAQDAPNEEADDDFGDDFDDFEEGGDADADDDDFGDFDDGFQEAAAAPTPPPQPVQPAQQPPSPALAFPIPDFEGLAADDILNALSPYLNGLYPPNDPLPAPPQLSNSIFLSPRSESLWSQLVAPPPLQPPDWIRSRIRRLFLVSLGVPVDLDEILPASKQKKLILPSLSALKGDSPRTSSESRSNTGAAGTSKNSVARLKQPGANGSNSSVDSQDKPSSSTRKRKGPPPPPELDMVAGQQLCMTTDEALDGMTDEELTAHLKKLELLEVAAKETLEYWTKRTEEKIGDREAFEGVIESLVAHARKTRK